MFRFFVAAAFGAGLLLSTHVRLPAQDHDLNEKWTRVDRLVASQRYKEAAPLAKEVADLAKAKYGAGHKEHRQALTNLLQIYMAWGRGGDAGAIIEELQSLPDLPPETAVDPESFEGLKGRVLALWNQRALDPRSLEKAIPLAKRVVELAKAQFPETDTLAEVSHNLGYLHVETGTFAEGEAALTDAYALRLRNLPSGHPHIALTGVYLAKAKFMQDKLDEASELYRAVLPKLEEDRGAEHPDVIYARKALFNIHMRRKDWPAALDAIKKVTESYRARAARITADTSIAGGAAEARASGALEFFRTYFMLEAWLRYVVEGADPATVADTFAAAQIGAEGKAGDALRHVGIKFGPRASPRLKELVHEQARLAMERTAIHRGGRMVDLRPRLDEIEKELKRIAGEIAAANPKYASLTSAEPVSLEQAQSFLSSGEVLVAFLDTPGWGTIPGGTFVWAAAPEGPVKWLYVDADAANLASRVADLRCGLDAALWLDSARWPDATEEQQREKGEQSAKRQDCLNRLKTQPHQESVKFGDKEQRVEVLPFDAERAYGLYKLLFGEIEDMIAGKHLIVVPSGALSTIPFNVLVTEEPTIAIPAKLANYRDVGWLGLRQPITTLPSVSALKALRCFSENSEATKQYLGVGNPLLDGRPEDPYDKALAAVAKEKQCAGPRGGKSALAMRAPSFRRSAALSRGVQANVAALRTWSPLPETADELCEIASLQQRSEVLIGENATEGTLKALSEVNDIGERGKLSDYKIVHFATHGALAGQAEGSAEPGLLLTPPREGSADPESLERDDGFLAASEIAALGLDADWVVLSACNTAAGGVEGAEALSGMARAFFQAGARALLVSHWEVDSGAAVKLTSRAFAALETNPALGRGEALRMSMSDVMRNGTLWEAHPAQWAPFAVVGDGGARRPGSRGLCPK